ncbi:heterokaryon incompatibility protein-domain-containing protein [Aspergillus ambiguus]|uniref:HET domain-containing protein n=1 Tax=Aspergillus ambiguus TaxID=176160 RepID=UPI003CCDBF64
MKEDSPRYVYSHIEPEEFRVLKILKVDPQIHFRLETFSIYEAPGYEALSYAWGTSLEKEECLCNGAPFHISRALGQALRGIHRQSASEWIWVDAICINQTDAEEKAHQVAGMGELYSCADQVLIWLGEESDQSGLACSLLPELTERIWALHENEGGWRPRKTEDIVSQRLPPPEDPLWRSVFLLYSRDWFQRLWIVQEIVLARQCVFVCGSQHIDWDVFMNFAIATSKSIFVGNIAGLHIQAMGEERAYRSTVGIRLVRNSWRLQKGLEGADNELDGLRAVLDIMQSQNAAFKVDYVYGVRGMLSEDMRQKVVVDYSDNVQQDWGIVHAKFFRQCLERLSDWPSLHFPPKSDRAGKPSWCPPWGSGWNSASLPLIGCRAGRSTTSGSQSSNGLSLMSGDGGDGVLRIAGIFVDTVQKTVPLDGHFEENTNIMRTNKLMKALQVCLAHVPDGPDVDQRLLGVLIGQCNWLESPQFPGRPNGNLLDSFMEFLKPLAAHEEHEGEPGYEPINLDTAEYILDEHRFWRTYLNLAMIRWPGRSFALTADSRLAMVPCETKSGDNVCVFLGATLPQVLSRHVDVGHWTYIGPSVVDGIMGGELFNTVHDWVSHKETFCLK